MTKLIIQIPCFNEEKTLLTTLEALPKAVEGISEIQVLVINDGSTDDSIKIVEEIKDSKVVDSSSDDGILLNEYNDKPITDDGGRLSLRILQAKNQYAVTILILLTLTKEMGFYGQWKHVSGNMRLLRAEHREASIGTSVSLIVLSLLYCLDLQ